MEKGWKEVEGEWTEKKKKNQELEESLIRRIIKRAMKDSLRGYGR